MKELYIRMKDGNKEVEFSIPEGDEKSSFVALQGAFDFLEVDIDLHSVTKKYLDIQKMYLDFYKESPKTDYTTTNEVVFLDDDALRAKGMKRRDGKILYRTRYRCTCGNSGNHYTPAVGLKIRCHSCKKEMKTKYARPKEAGMLQPNEQLAYFVAGEEEGYEM